MQNHLKLALLAAPLCTLCGVVAGCASESAPPSGSEPTGASQALVSGATCSDRIATMLAAPIAPPSIGSMNLARTNGKGDLVGITYGSTQLDGCEQYRERENDQNPSYPGYRYAAFSDGPSSVDGGVDPGDPVTIAYSVESKVVQQVTLSGPDVTGNLTFQSRTGGKYGDGHTYVLSLANGGSVTKDGADFPADWSYVVTKGKYEASAWVNEMYDGILATFDPSMAPAKDGDCASSTFTFDGTGLPVPHQSECLFIPNDGAGSSYLGVRALHFYMVFAQGTNQAKTVYEDAQAGLASCATPVAAVERMDFAQVLWGAGNNYTTDTEAFSLGGLSPILAVSQPTGLTFSEANTLEGCGGVPVDPSDPGYGAMAWGASGEVMLEYNLTTGVAYKVAVRDGYRGSFQVTETLSDGSLANYVIAPGTFTLNGAPVTIDWTNAATASKAITGLSNAFDNDYMGWPDALDCRHTGACTIVLDDGHGNATFSLQPPTRLGLPSLALTFVFPNKTSVPSEMFTVNPGAQ